MAYFDSAKNQAHWDLEMSQLRQAKDLRASTGFAPGEKQVQAQPTASAHRIPITFAQLEQLVKSQEVPTASSKTAPQKTHIPAQPQATR